MLLIAYGGTQNDQLQLRRPESCYPAVGFSIYDGNNPALSLPGGASGPIRRLSARLNQRAKQIWCWTRIDECLVLTGGEQHTVRFCDALDGLVLDGGLVRMSTLTLHEARGDVTLARALVERIGLLGRRVLLGTRCSAAGGPPPHV